MSIGAGSTPKPSWRLVAGVTIALIGLMVPALRWLYDYAWFVGFVVSGGLYFVLMRRQVSVLK